MQVVIIKHCLVGERSYSPGDKAEVPDAAAHRLMKFGHATVDLEETDAADDVETATATPPTESASAEPGKRRKA